MHALACNINQRPYMCILIKLINFLIVQVIWIEHVEVDNSEVHDLYKIFVKSTVGFGARRWVATLDRHCERLASSMAINIPVGELGGGIYKYMSMSFNFYFILFYFFCVGKCYKSLVI